MIEFKNLSAEEPYEIFNDLYQKALKENQPSIEAFVISSFNDEKKEVDSRFVNLKYIVDKEWIFFSNYNSEKSKSFSTHPQISAIFYWNKINTQIRIKANISKTSEIFSDEHFRSRSEEKNALAISSSQSEKIESFKKMKDKYFQTLKNKKILQCRPSYWGGFSFFPYYFEFWKGNDFRLNRRSVYKKEQKGWIHHLLQP